jgi:ribose 1,5-bisphosphokinase PhnN
MHKLETDGKVVIEKKANGKKMAIPVQVRAVLDSCYVLDNGDRLI